MLDSGLADLDCEGCTDDCEQETQIVWAGNKGAPGLVDSLHCCPLHWFPSIPGEMQIWGYYAAYNKHGILPKQGGLDDQPHVVMWGIGIIGNEVARAARWAMANPPKGRG